MTADRDLMFNGLTEAETNETASVRGLIGRPSPAEGDASLPDPTRDQADAWAAVCDALREVSPGWHKNGETGLDAAVATIRSFANVQPNAHANGLASAPRLSESQPLESNLRSLATNPEVAISVYGAEWAGCCAASALDALKSQAQQGDGMLKPLIYAAMMHNGKPKTVAEFERAAANVADMLQRRAEVTHNKPVASIYISDDGSREFDDWRVDLPPGNHQLFTAPRPAQPQPEGMPAEWLDAFEEWRQTLGAADLDGKRDLVWRHIAGTGFQAGAAWARSQAPAPGADTVPYAKFAELLRQEHALSDAYVRLREIIGAMDPPTVSDTAQLWAYVESVARSKLTATQAPAVKAEVPVATNIADAFLKCKDEAIKSGAHESYQAVREAFDALQAALVTNAAPSAAEALQALDDMLDYSGAFAMSKRRQAEVVRQALSASQPPVQPMGGEA